MGISIAQDNLTKEEAFAALVFYFSEWQRHEKTLVMIEKCLSKIQDEHGFNNQEVARAHELSERYVTFDENLDAKDNLCSD